MLAGTHPVGNHMGGHGPTAARQEKEVALQGRLHKDELKD